MFTKTQKCLFRNPEPHLTHQTLLLVIFDLKILGKFFTIRGYPYVKKSKFLFLEIS
jgi:hypothetical protein